MEARSYPRCFVFCYSLNMLAEIEARALKLQRKLAVALATYMLCVGMLKQGYYTESGQ